MTAVLGTAHDRVAQAHAEHVCELTEIGSGVWLARLGSDFAGLIERMWGAGYRVTDGRGAIIGEFATFESASARLVG